jgi:hypothetical protein
VARTIPTKKNRKGYIPDELVTNYMKQKLHFEKRRQSEKLRGRDLTQDEEYPRLKKRKTDVLDRMFRSMANLTFFFQSVAEHSELAKVFDEDIKDLLGIKCADPQKQVPGYIFSNLLRSILKAETRSAQLQSKGEGSHNKDFRLYLNHCLQGIISDKVRMSLDGTFNNYHARDVVLNDFTRVWAWTKMLADTADLSIEDESFPSRTFDFEADKWSKINRRSI